MYLYRKMTCLLRFSFYPVKDKSDVFILAYKSGTIWDVSGA